jgi:hypothetical protein
MQVLIRGAIAEHFAGQVDGYTGDGTRLPLIYLDREELVRGERPPVCDDSAIAHLLDAIRQLADLWTTTAPDARAYSARDNYLASDWNRIVNAYLDDLAHRGKTDAEIKRLEDWLCAETRVIWAKTCATWDDLIVRAAIACHWCDPGPEEIIANTPPNERFDDQAFAYLIKGILNMSGLRFDRDGRYIGPEAAEQADKRVVAAAGSWID